MGRNGKAGAVPAALLIVIGVAALVVVGVWLWLRLPRAPEQPAALTEEAKAYVRAGSLQLSNVNMGAKESFAKQTLVEITGSITNSGKRAVAQVEIVCVFQDPYGQVVARERQPIVRERGGGLKPGETKAFRLAFDNLPESWNQAMPQLVIAGILFG